MKKIWMKLYTARPIYDESGYITCEICTPKKGCKWIIKILNMLKLM